MIPTYIVKTPSYCFVGLFQLQFEKFTECLIQTWMIPKTETVLSDRIYCSVLLRDNCAKNKNKNKIIFLINTALSII